MTPGNPARQTQKESAMTTQANHLEILSVTAQGQRTVWTRIGTAFPTKDGKGYRLKSQVRRSPCSKLRTI